MGCDHHSCISKAGDGGAQTSACRSDLWYTSLDWPGQHHGRAAGQGRLGCTGYLVIGAGALRSCVIPNKRNETIYELPLTIAGTIGALAGKWLAPSQCYTLATRITLRLYNSLTTHHPSTWTARVCVGTTAFGIVLVATVDPNRMAR